MFVVSVYLHGWKSRVVVDLFGGLLLCGIAYGMGVFFYVSRFPESKFKTKFTVQFFFYKKTI